MLVDLPRLTFKLSRKAWRSNVTGRASFLSGDRPDDVALFLSASIVDEPESLLEYGERIEGGVLLVVDGDRGRRAFQAATGSDALSFASEARQHDGTVERTLSGGECPHADGDDESHEVAFIFAFAEEKNPEVGGIYAAGDVIHAYAKCSCGTSYADRWVIED